MISVFKYIPEHIEGSYQNAKEYFIIEVRTDRIAVFKADGKLIHVVSGINIKSCHF
jgi:hypothetical protein